MPLQNFRPSINSEEKVELFPQGRKRVWVNSLKLTGKKAQNTPHKEQRGEIF